MNTRSLATLLAVLSLNPLGAFADPNCPKTSGSNALGAPFPRSQSWYGSEAFAVMLPPDGIWSTTAPGASLAVKLFWFSSGFKPGMETHLTTRIRNLNGGDSTARMTQPSNAADKSLGGWTMLTGIDFPDPGCWEITGEYFGQVLTFVVETVSSAH